MKCLRCGFANESESKFCEECGEKLVHVVIKSMANIRKNKSHSQTMSRQISELEDVIFKPKHSQKMIPMWLSIILIVIFVPLAAIIGYGIFASFDSQDASVKNSQSNLTSSPITSLVTITDAQTKWISNEMYLTGVLHNANKMPIKNTFVRVDFYRDKERTKHFDTRNVDVGGTSSSGAFSFQVPLSIYPAGNSWWSLNIEQVEGY